MRGYWNLRDEAGDHAGDEEDDTAEDKLAVGVTAHSSPSANPPRRTSLGSQRTAHTLLASVMRRNHSVASERDTRDAGESETLGDEVDVTCGVVGIPSLLLCSGDSRLQGGASIFESLVKASEVELDLITCDVMRATIAFKWQVPRASP